MNILIPHTWYFESNCRYEPRVTITIKPYAKMSKVDI